MPPVRPCHACGAVDDHPRHVITHPDGSDTLWHMDCHARATACHTCLEQLDRAEWATGDALRRALTGQD